MIVMTSINLLDYEHDTFKEIVQQAFTFVKT